MSQNHIHIAYAAAIADFVKTEDCSQADAVILSACCVDIAWRFNKTPEQVSEDINRHYTGSYSAL